MKTSYFKRFLAVCVISMAATAAFADDAAPVYDVDNLPPQFDGQPDGSAAQAAAGPAPVSQQASLTLDQRVRKVEQQVTNLQNKNSSDRVDALQNDLRTLRGQVEELTHQLQRVQTEQRAMYTDMDKRLSSASVKKSATVPPPSHSATQKKVTTAAASTTTADVTPTGDDVASQPNVAEEQEIYQTAYDLIKAKKYNDAIIKLQSMLQKYPSGQFAANAHYWLGELYNLTNKNTEAAQEFMIIIKDYPDSPRIADAQLKLGLIYATQFKWSEAKAAFKKVMTLYPGTSTARVASEQLKQIKQAGH